jgi:hypothetical protein
MAMHACYALHPSGYPKFRAKNCTFAYLLHDKDRQLGPITFPRAMRLPLYCRGLGTTTLLGIAIS